MSLLLILKNDLSVIGVTVATTDGQDFTQASVTPVAVSQSASGMSRKFWTDYYTKAWAKPVLVEAEIALPATMVKKSTVAVIAAIAKPKVNVIEQVELNTLASAFVAGLFKENAVNIAAELAIIESIPLKSQELIEEEELLLMAMVL